MSYIIEPLQSVLSDLADIHTDREGGADQAEIDLRVKDAVERLGAFLGTRSASANSVWTKARPEAADLSANALAEAIGKLEAYLNGALDWYTAYPKAEGRIDSASGYLSIDDH
jgi:hypothetical protein